MKVAVLGYFERESTCVGFSDGLEACGALVQRHCYRGKDSPKPSIDDVLKGEPDHVLLMKGAFMELDEVARLAARCDLTYATFDSMTCGYPNRVERLGGRALLARRALATGAEVVRWFREHGLPATQVFQGCRPGIWKPGDGPGGQRKSVLFTGSTYPWDNDRAGRFAALGAAGIPLEHHPRGVYLEECARLNWEHAVVLNLVLQRSPGIFSNRVVRALSSGGAVLSQACDDLEHVLQVELARGRGAPFELFHDDAGLVEKARRWLDHPGEREAVISAGRAWAARHTWDHQAEKYVRVLRGERVQDDGAASGAA